MLLFGVACTFATPNVKFRSASKERGPGGAGGRRTMDREDRTIIGIVVGITALAFALSYQALMQRHHAAAGGDILSHAYPLVVEGATSIATYTAYKLRALGARATAYPWTLAALFFALSAWINAEPETVPDSIVRVVPSVAIPLSVHLVTHLLRHRRAAQVDEVTAVDEAQADEAEAPAVDEVDEAPAAELFPAPVDEAPPAPTRRRRRSEANGKRRWARENGYKVSDSGRLPVAVEVAYAAAH